MLTKSKVIHIHIDIPHFKWLRLYIPLFIFTELYDCLLDLVALGAWIAPNAKPIKKLYTLKQWCDLLKTGRLALSNLYVNKEEDLINIAIKKAQIFIRIKMY